MLKLDIEKHDQRHPPLRNLIDRSLPQSWAHEEKQALEPVNQRLSQCQQLSSFLQQ